MEWIEGIEREGSGYRLAFKGKDGAARLGKFKELRSAATTIGDNILHLDGADLTEMTLVSSEEFLSLAGLPISSQQNHLVYQLRVGKVRVLIPAAGIILGLLGSVARLDDLPFRASSLDLMVSHTVEDGVSKICFGPETNFVDKELSPFFQERMRWMTAYAGGRRFWSSIRDFAKQGVLGVHVPKVQVSGWFRGITRGECFLATRLHLASITPLEEPLPFAKSLRGQTFAVADPNVIRPMFRGADETLLMGEHGWALSDFEWDEIVAPLLGRQALFGGRGRFDLILEKLGTGGQFRGSIMAGNLSSWLLKLKKNGKWEQVKERLMLHRRAYRS